MYQRGGDMEELERLGSVSPIFPVKEKGSGRNKSILCVSTCLCGSYPMQGFHDYEHRTLSQE